MQKFLSQFIFTRAFIEHAVSFLGIVCIVLIGKDFLVFFLTAFLCASLFGSSSRFIHLFLSKNHHKIPKTLRPLITKITSEKGLIFILYTVFAFVCVYTVSDIGPTLIADMAKLLQDFSQKFGVDIGMSGLQNTL